MLLSFWRQTITRVRPRSKEERGSVIPDWENTDKLTIGGCSVQPASTSLSQDGRVHGISNGLTAYVPPTADVRAGDHILYNGAEYTITGDPLIWPSATGDLDHIQLNLMRWRG